MGVHRELGAMGAGLALGCTGSWIHTEVEHSLHSPSHTGKVFFSTLAAWLRGRVLLPSSMCLFFCALSTWNGCSTLICNPRRS